MSIQSLGVGSGLALDDLVKQLLEAERKPKVDRLDAREEKVEAEISGLGQIKSKLSAFRDAVKALKSDRDLNGREPKLTHPSEDFEIFTADASNSALTGSYKIAIKELATGSRATTADGAYSSSSDSVLSSGAGSLTFGVGSDSFTVDVSAGMTLAELREKINSHADNFGVNANIVSTGTAAGAKLVFTSDVTGAGNDLTISNDLGNAELDKLSTSGGLSVTSATNAKATIDGIDVESDSNTFENTIQNVTFTAKEVSPFMADGVTYQTSTMDIGYDTEALDKKIRDFVENYNGIIKEIKTLTKYGASELEDDGILAGDSMVRSIQSGLSSIMGGSISGSSLGGLFALGIEINSDGELEIGDTDFGLGSGEERLTDALEDNFDEVAKLFTDEEGGIAVRLDEYLKQYTSSSGLITLRERAAKDDRDQIYDDREKLELRMSSYEQMLRDKYLNLDQTVSKLNRTGAALLMSL